MPAPTREAFDKAAAKVAASAPPGLTREQFYQRIDSELAPTPSLAEQMGSRPSGGYTMGDSDSQDHPVMDALSSAAHPQTAGDILGLMIPTELGALASSRRAASAVNPAATTMRDVVIGGAKGLTQAITHPTRSIVGAGLGSLIGGPAGAATGAAVSAGPKIVKGIRAETAARMLANAPKEEGLATGYERFMPNISAAHEVTPAASAPIAPLAERAIQRTILTPQEQALLGELSKGEPARAASKAKVISPRTLSPNEERGIAVLDKALTAIHGPDYRLPGNGLYKDPTDTLIEQLMKTEPMRKLPIR